MNQTIYDAVIIGGGPSGATAATDLALAGHSAGAYNAVMLALDPQWLRATGSDTSVIRGVAALAGGAAHALLRRQRPAPVVGQVPDDPEQQPIQRD